MNENHRNPDGRRSDEAFMAAARDELECSAAGIDALTAARLRALRLRALGATRRPSGFRTFTWQPAGSVALVALFVLGLLLLKQQTGPAVPAAEAYELLAGAHGHDIVENPDFYEWLDTQYKIGAAPELDEI